jgi:Holliday junction resolvase RusA-like endonuclease
MIYKFTAPLYIILAKSPSGKKYHLNLNNYRNWKSIISNNLKKKYKEIMTKQLIGKKLTHPIEIKFIYIKGQNRKVDRANVLSVHEKFFCDALVECGCLPDDNDIYITKTTYVSNGIDPGNGRVEIEITEI